MYCTSPIFLDFQQPSRPFTQELRDALFDMLGFVAMTDKDDQAKNADPATGQEPTQTPPPAATFVPADLSAAHGIPPAMVGVAAIVGLVMGLGLGALAFGEDSGESAAPAPSAKPVKKAPPKVLSVVDKLRAADHDTMEAYSEKDPISLETEELFALHEGKATQKRLALEGYAEQLEGVNLLEDSDKLARLKEFARDPDTMIPTLRLIANMDSALGMDLLYYFWIGTKRENALTKLSQVMVHSKDLRAKASPALAVAIDLREALKKDPPVCETFADLIPRITEVADSRSHRLVAKLFRDRGCGKPKREDCYACIHEDKKPLKVALAATRTRKAPKVR